MSDKTLNRYIFHKLFFSNINSFDFALIGCELRTTDDAVLTFLKFYSICSFLSRPDYENKLIENHPFQRNNKIKLLFNLMDGCSNYNLHQEKNQTILPPIDR